MNVIIQFDDRSLAVLEGLAKALNCPNVGDSVTPVAKEPAVIEPPAVAPAPVASAPIDLEALRLALADFCKLPENKARLKETFASLGVTKLTEVKPEDLPVLAALVEGV